MTQCRTGKVAPRGTQLQARKEEKTPLLQVISKLALQLSTQGQQRAQARHPQGSGDAALTVHWQVMWGTQSIAKQDAQG